MMEPLISIIIPIHNVEKYITKTLNSCMEQTYKNIEVIMVNDGSTDDSSRIASCYQMKDSRYRLLDQEQKGLSGARNKGIDISSGDYIMFLDGDDWLQPDTISILYKALIQTNSDISICQLMKIGEDEWFKSKGTEHLDRKEFDQTEALKELFLGKYFRFSACGKLFKRELFHFLRFPEGRVHEDLATTYKVFSNSCKSVYTGFEGYMYVQRNGSILNHNYNVQRLQVLDAWGEIIPYMHKNHPETMKQVINMYAYQCTNHFYEIVKSQNSIKLKIYMLSRIRHHMKKHKYKIDRYAELLPHYKRFINFFIHGFSSTVCVYLTKNSIDHLVGRRLIK